MSESINIKNEVKIYTEMITELSVLKWYNKKKRDVILELFRKLNDEQRNVIIYLLKKFLVHDQNSVSGDLLDGLALKLNSILNKGKLLLAGTKNDEDIQIPKSSDVILYHFKHILKIKFLKKFECEIAQTVDGIIKQIQSGEKFQAIVFIDDFCGSGQTITGIYNQVKDNLKDTKVIVASIVMMEEAYRRIAEEINPYNVLTCFKIQKGVSDANDLRDEDKQEFKKILKSISKNNNLRETYYLGYKKSEALYTGLNTPNNTFGIFWECKDKNNEGFPAIFPRAF